MLGEYRFVDVAIGGVYRRNKVRKVDDLPALLASLDGTAVDCFASYLRFTEELLHYAARNPSPRTGKPPSVAGYPGPALATHLPFDFDCADDLAKALADARMFVRRLDAEYGVPARALRLYFSGFKGFSGELPDILFGGFAPSVDIAERLKRLALKLAAGIETVDFSIYEKMRLWRLPNTRHGEGLFKIPLTAEELLTLEPEDIRELARQRREIQRPADDDWQTITELVDLWNATATAEESERPHRAERVPETIPEGRRNSTLTSVAGSMRRRGCSAEVILAALLERPRGKTLPRHHGLSRHAGESPRARARPRSRRRGDPRGHVPPCRAVPEPRRAKDRAPRADLDK